MNIRADLQRDSIIFKHVYSGGVIFDPSLNKYVYEHWTSDAIYRRIEEECNAAGLRFNISDFNEYISSIRVYGSNQGMSWDRFLSAAWLLAGEVVVFNPGMDSTLTLLKLSPSSYLVLDSKEKDNILSVVATNGEVHIDLKRKIHFNPLGDVEINWISILPPNRVSRTVDYINSKLYNRNKVSRDISEIVSRTIVSLHQNDFISDFPDIVKTFALNGISSGVVLKIAEAYLKKYPIV